MINDDQQEMFESVSVETTRMIARRPFDSVAARAAKQVLAERLTAIGAQYVPSGWTVTWRKSLSGRCHHDEKRLAAPRPVTRKSLYIFLHECAHSHLHDHAVGRRKPSHVKEHEAERWAHARMREHGIAVPRAMTQRAKAYVARKIRQARARGAKTIDAAAARFAGVSKFI
jgi:hypothetical protein